MKIYEDNAKEKLSEERFSMMSGNYVGAPDKFSGKRQQKIGVFNFSCFMGTARIVGLFSWIKQGTSHRELIFCYNCNIFCNTSDDKENKTKKNNAKTALKWLEIEIK